MAIFNELKCYTENKFHQNISKNQTEKNLWKLSEVFNIEITHIHCIENFVYSYF